MNSNDTRFEDRVKLLFGSKLFESVPKSSFPASSWSVADGAVERREWNRDRGLGHRDREDDPCCSAFYDKDGCLFKNRSKKKKKSTREKEREFEGDLDDDEEEEEREIRSSVGLDPTLDNEDEEDEYDKAALCRENTGERVYMRDVNDHGPYMNYHVLVPDSIDEPSSEAHYFQRDPRADHFAARERLKEDKSAHPSKESSENDANLKPILKRKEPQIVAKPKKRVKFDPNCNDDHHDKVSEEPQDFAPVPRSMEADEVPKACTSIPKESSGIPDYLKNPSKYARYTFDLSDRSDEETNSRAFEDFRDLVKRPGHDLSVELPKSVIFTPRKKSVDAVPMHDSPVNPKVHGQVSGCSVASEIDASEMNEDDVETPTVASNMISRKSRTYRSKSISNDGI